jgi:hypothetical protein
MRTTGVKHPVAQICQRATRRREAFTAADSCRTASQLVALAQLILDGFTSMRSKRAPSARGSLRAAPRTRPRLLPTSPVDPQTYDCIISRSFPLAGGLHESDSPIPRVGRQVDTDG